MTTSLHNNFPRGSAEQLESTIANAKFAKSASIVKTPSLSLHKPNVQGKIYLGVINGDISVTELQDGRIERFAMGGLPIGAGDDRHMLTVAGSRSGKGRSTIIPNLIVYPGSLLAIDPKGENAKATAEWRADMLGQRVVLLDPFGTTPKSIRKKFAGGFNPLTLLEANSPSLLEDAGLIADALIVTAPGEKNPHWNESSRMFLTGVLLHIATDSNYTGKRNLVSVYEFIMSLDEDLKNEMIQNSAHPSISYSADSFFDKPDTERETVLSTLRRHIDFIGFERVQKVLSTHSIDLSQLKTENVSIYLCLPATKMGICSGWLRLFVNLTLDAMERQKSRPKHPVLMCLDEFAILGHMKSLEDAVGQIAGFGCKLWPILQDLGQLQALYGKRWETFVENSGVLQFFGNSGMQTLEWISKRLGQTTVQSANVKTPGYSSRVQSGDTGDSWGQQSHPLMTPEEISRFFGRDDELLRQLIIRPTWPAMVLQRAYYDKHEMFDEYRKFMGMNP
ncbi:MAG: type IV secretory system conjugative DNA transfer family protein [Verrucomicrobiae bacterium]|nr:type IV secretory system conjugative DNA transfer family protein [Verrucomicrobiae bacterium]NNJ42653.1 type IV secretory system conjugative DNA transfer family protein [Akkermansiaceae bacterium]